jgi:hypothetical protein
MNALAMPPLPDGAHARRPAPDAPRPWPRPGCQLLFLAPFLHQCLSGTKPPGQWLQPPVLLVSLLVYGCGALACHELAVRRRNQSQPFWPVLLSLGLGYGLLVEGVMLGTLTSPDWPRLGPLADLSHGRMTNVNWTLGLLALWFHVVLSVALPVLIIELGHPELAGRAWLSDRGLAWARALFYVVVVGGALGRGKEWHGGDTALVALAWWWLRSLRRWRPRLRPARRWLARRLEGPASPRRVFWGWTAVTWALLLDYQVAPGQRPVEFLRPFWFALGTWLAMRYAARQTARRVTAGWSPRHSLALIWGALWPWLLLALGHGPEAYFEPYPRGMGLVAVLTAWGLWRLRRGVGRGA